MNKVSILAILVSVGGPGAALAQDIGASFELDDAIVIGRLLPTTEETTGTTVDTVEGEALQTDGVSVTSGVDRLPGVSFTSSGGLGAESSLRVRGLDRKYIGVRIDGIDVTDPASVQTSYNWGTLTSGAIDRLSLLKGSQSAIYGSNAIAGVFEIETWRPKVDGRSGRTTLEFGSNNTIAATGSYGYRDDTTELALSLGRIESDGFSARASNDEDDGFSQTSLNISGSRQITETVRLGFSALATDSLTEIDRSDFDETGEADETQYGLRGFVEVDTGAWLHEVSATAFKNDRFDAGGFTQSFVGERLTLAYIARGSLWDEVELAFGADWTEERSSLDGDEDKASNAAVFAEAQFSPSAAVETSVTLRYDDYSDFDGQLSGQAALAWFLSDATTLRASVGTGYRAPSLYERFGPFAGTDLVPEESRSVDLGVSHRFGTAGEIEATLFRTEIDDLIGFGAGSYEQVPGTTVSQGFELSGTYALTDRVALAGAYTYTDAKTDEARQLRVPRHDLSLGVNAALTDRLDLGVALTHVRGALDASFGPPPDFATVLVPLDDYTVLDAALSYAVSDDTTAYFAIDNIADEDYEKVLGFNTPERTFRVGLRKNF